MKKFIFMLAVTPFGFAFAQNVGIGTNAPLAPLHIRTSAAEAMRLQSTDPFIGFYDNSGNYGAFVWLNKLFGNDLRLGTPQGSNIAIALSPNTSTALYVAANGNVGIGNSNPAYRFDVTGRMRIRNGSDGEPGIWLNQTSNAGVAAFVGLQDNSRVGFYGAGGIGWGFTMNTANGALAINGNYGTAGQVLMSNGSSAAPAWTYAASQFFVANQTGQSGDLGTTGEVDIPGLVANFTIAAPARVVMNVTLRLVNRGCFTCGDRRTLVALRQNVVGGVQLIEERVVYTPNSEYNDLSTGPIILDLGAGSYSYKVSLLPSVYGTATVYALKGRLSWSFYPL